MTIALATALVASASGTNAVAGYGTGVRLEYLLVPVIFGLGAPLVALVGTNIGAGQKQRALRIALVGGAIAFAISETLGLIAALLAAGVARAIQSRSGRDRDGQRLSADCRTDVWILWLGHGALFRIPGRRATFLASVDWIPPRLGCDWRWLACASPNRFAQLAVRGARLRPDRLRCHAYGGGQIGRVVWSRVIDKSARLAMPMNITAMK